jgi:HK97 family phage major capsid protein
VDPKLRLVELKNSQKSLLAKVKNEKRVFTDDESTQFDAWQKEIEDCKKLIIAEENASKTEDFLKVEPVDQIVIPKIEVKDNGPKWKNGMGEMLQAVVNAATGRGVDSRLVKNQLGANEGLPSEGGFLIETDHSPELIKRTYETAAVASRCRRNPVSGNRITVNYVNETSRVTGSRMGGLRGYWINEAGTLTPTMPTLGQMELKLKKLGGLFYSTEELLADQTALQSFVNESFPEEFAWLLDDAILNGNGAINPLGLANAPCTINVAAEAAQPAGTIVYENVLKMWSRMWAKSRANSVWFINQDCEPQLATMGLVIGAGGIPVYMPAGGVSGTPYSTLFGRPVIPIEQCATCGTVGDIILADMSQYQLIDKGGIQTAESIHVAFLTDQRAFRFIYRVDGQPRWASALTPANGTNTLSPFVRLATR